MKKKLRKLFPLQNWFYVLHLSAFAQSSSDESSELTSYTIGPRY